MASIGRTLINEIDTSLRKLQIFMTDNLKLDRGVICIEVVWYSYDNSGHMKEGFAYRPIVATGTARDEKRIQDFIIDTVRSAHRRYIETKTEAAEISWETSPAILRYIDHTSKKGKFSYSIVIGVVGGTREQNELIAGQAELFLKK